MTAFRFSREFETSMLARCDVQLARTDTTLAEWRDAHALPVPGSVPAADLPAPAGRHARG